MRFAALAASGFRCRYCGATAHEDRLQVDHVIPVSRGGTDDLGNLVAACATCNNGKSAMRPEGEIQWRPLIRTTQHPWACPGNVHDARWTEHVIGPPDGSYIETVIVCEACHGIVAIRRESAG